MIVGGGGGGPVASATGGLIRQGGIGGAATGGDLNVDGEYGVMVRNHASGGYGDFYGMQWAGGDAGKNHHSEGYIAKLCIMSNPAITPWSLWQKDQEGYGHGGWAVTHTSYNGNAGFDGSPGAIIIEEY